MSDTIKRHEMHGEMHGIDWVRASDHLAAMAERDAEIARYKGAWETAVKALATAIVRAERAEQGAAEYNTALRDEQERNAGLSERLIKAEQEVAGLREKLDLVYAAGRDGISHVAAANYAERIREARAGLQFAYYGDEEAARAGGGHE
jgi:hypothetical protein